MKCSVCGLDKPPKEGKRDRLPRGWKRGPNEGPVCNTCWKKKHVMRSLVLPVVCPLSCTWDEFRQLLNDAWGRATSLANWTIQMLARSDVVRTPDLAKLPSMPMLNLYPLIRQRNPAAVEVAPGVVVQPYPQREEWAGAALSANLIMRQAEADYREARYNVVWMRDERTPLRKWPVPFPIDADGWSISIDDERPVASISLPGGRVRLLLQSGKQFRRQMEGVQHLVRGTGIKCEAAIYRKRASLSDHRASMETRPNDGGNRVQWRIMLKLVAWLPRQPQNGGDGQMIVRTGRDPFLSATVNGDEPWVLHAPWVRMWITEHARFLQQISDDSKYEKRWPKRMRRGFADYRERRVKKHHDRMKTFLEQTAASLTGHARRRRVAGVTLDSTDRSFAESFPWYQFIEVLLTRQFGEAGIDFSHVASAEVVDENPSPARGDINQ